MDYTPYSSQPRRIEKRSDLALELDLKLKPESQLAFYNEIECNWKRDLEIRRKRITENELPKKKKNIMNIPNGFPLKDCVRLFLVLLMTGYKFYEIHHYLLSNF